MSDNPYEGPQARVPSWATRRWIIGPLVVAAFLFVLATVIIPSVRQAREAALRTLCKGNFGGIASALHNYHQDYGSFPPAYTIDVHGNRLHSWRTLILPYLDQRELHASIDLTKAWNHPANSKAFAREVHTYRCPASTIDPGQTSYLAIVGEGTCFPEAKARPISEITDGTSSTLLICEFPADAAVHWMSPQDADERLFLTIAEDSALSHTGGMMSILADGTTRFLSAELPVDVRRALVSAAAGDKLGEY